MAEPGLNEVQTASMRNRSKIVKDNVSNNNALLNFMKRKGNIKKGETGTSLFEEFDFTENPSVMAFEGSDPLDTTQVPVLSSYEYTWKELAGNCQINGRERVQNGGIHQSLKLLAQRMDNLERSLYNEVNGQLLSDGTGSGGKEIGGLDLLFPEDPTAGTVGGVSRVTNPVARSYKYAAIADGGSAASVTNIERYMRRVRIATHREGDIKDLIWILDNNYYELVSEAAASRQRFVESDKGLADLGIPNFKVEGITCVLGGGYVSAVSGASTMPANTGWLVNAGTIKWKIGQGAFFTPLEKRSSQNQNVEITYLWLCSALTCGNFGLNGRLFNS